MILDKHITTYMDIAKLWAEQSYCTRLKVGAVVVTNDGGIYSGYNGMPTGMQNVCEIDGKTRPEVIHAEQNAFDKMLLEGVSSRNATLFCTHSPCIECAKRIFQSGVIEVIYGNYYRGDGVQFLEDRCVPVSVLVDGEKVSTLMDGYSKIQELSE
jgi:dCMP deaminase